MVTISLKERGIEKEFVYRFSKSGGKGGQHVNTTDSKAEVEFDILASHYLSAEEKVLIMTRLKSKLTTEAKISVYSQKGRSQLQNKNEASRILLELLDKALIVMKKRKPTKVSKAVKIKRRESKKKTSIKKKVRKKPSRRDLED